jgi:mutator protein MutT
MDFGSLVCTAKAPLCSACLLEADCNALRRDDTALRASSTGRTSSKIPVEMRNSGKPVYDVAAAIIRDSGNVLLTRRPEGKHLADTWEFPGGKREAGESWRECLKREIMEELGIEISVRPVWRVKHFEYDDRIVSLRFYRCSLLKGTPQSREGQEIRWAKQKKLDEFDFPEANVGIVEELLSGK